MSFPIFVVGFARSGTTLLQSLLACLDEVLTVPETHFFRDLARLNLTQNRLDTSEARRLLDAMRERHDIAPSHVEELLGVGHAFSVASIFEFVLGELSGLDLKTVRSARWIEKTPAHALHLERIGRVYPEARVIFMLRDPRLAFASRREINATGGWGEGWIPIEELCSYYQRFRDAARVFERGHPHRLKYVKLEDLVTKPESVLRDTCEFLELRFAPDMLSRIHRDASILRSDEYWKLDAVQRPVDPVLATRQTRAQLSDFELWRTTTLLAADLEEQGYPVANTDRPPLTEDVAELLLRTVEYYRQVVVPEKETRIRRLERELRAIRNKPLT
jgi:hypothetical protein